MTRLLIILLFLGNSFISSTQTTAYTRAIDFGKNGGEQFVQIQDFEDGYLVDSYQSIADGDDSYLGTLLTKLNAADEPEKQITFQAEYQYHQQTVVTVDNKIFHVGVPEFASGTAFHFSILNSDLEILTERKISLPFEISVCKFYPTLDGGVIGAVYEVCNYNRIIKIDSEGNVEWFKSYGTTSGSRALVRGIHSTDEGYTIAGYLGFNDGLMFYKIDEEGELLSWNFVAPGEGVSDVLWEVDQNDDEIICRLRNPATPNTAGIIQLNGDLEVTQSKLLHYSAADTTAEPREIFITDNAYLVLDELDNTGPLYEHDVSAVCIDKSTFEVKWATIGSRAFIQTNGYYFSGTRGPNNEIICAGNLGPINWETGAAHFDTFYLTNLNAESGLGFCDGEIVSASFTALSYEIIPHEMDTIASDSYTESDVVFTHENIAPKTSELICHETAILLENTLDFKAYPNPTDGLLIIEIPSMVPGTEIQIFDALGRKVTEIEKLQYHNAVHFSESGIYFIKIINSDGLIGTKKVIVH